ncbi:MAG: hypothetical protein IPO21_11790 [Bacteroidales bacterium]|nr:hypothetical protein [Bacteroidales bacterium]
MKVKQFKITNLEECHKISAEKADWVLCFGAKALLENQEITKTLLDKFKGAEIAFCSTAGRFAKNAAFATILWSSRRLHLSTQNCDQQS